MKRYMLRAAKIACALLILAVCIGVVQEYLLCHADHNRERVKGFYQEPKNSLDVVYIGASDVYSDIAPGYAYKRDGITGYLFATQADSILNYKSQLDNVLSRQKDALVVVELNGALYGDKEEVTKEANLRNYSDHAPLNFNKVQWVAENIKENHAEYLFPIMKYHGIWNDTVEEVKDKKDPDKIEYKTTNEFESEAVYRQTIINDKQRGYNYLKGILNWPVVFRSPQKSMNSQLAANANSKKPLTEIEEKALRDLLQYCKDKELKNVVFARFPHIVTEKTYERFERSNTVGDIVAEYGFDYLNFERDIALTGLSETEDFYNLDHLNVYGQQKFTAYVTDYLKEHYGLAPRTLDSKLKAEWDACADYYDAYVRYNKALMNSNINLELSENYQLIEKLKGYLPDKV